MFGKRKPDNSYLVPHNSKINMEQRSALSEHAANLKENNCDRSVMNKCPHCENMAKNFLYLESLIRNNCEKEHKCGLCQSSLKYLQYVNKNIMQVFGNFDSIVHAARVFSSQVPPSPKYAVKKPDPKNIKSMRSEGGAMLTSQKSISKTLGPIKSQKSKKSIKTIKSSKSGKSLSKSKKKANTGTKKGISHGKQVLKSKFKLKPSKSPKLKKQLSNVVRSASKNQSMRTVRSKLANKSKQLKKPPPTSINWRLLKRNLPQRGIVVGVQ